MGLTAKEQAALDALTKKSKEPDPPSVGKSLNISIDLGDEKQLALAKKYGFLPEDEPEEEETDEEEEGDDTPKRRGYFGE